MVYIENTGLRDCSGFLQIGSHMANREYRYVAYCNILQYIAIYIARYCVICSRLKNKMTNKCIKVIISACL